MNAPHPPADGEALSSGLKPRHVTMISIAGVIGAGLFVGSASAIKLAGPSVLIAYALAGTLVVLVMRMLGEMATVNPDTGSFSVYADRALGKWAGFSIGWLYWWAWALIIPVEATAGATILHNWIDWPQWVFAFLITAILTATNLVSVGNYGEFEFWFALIKVVAIVAFILVGVAAIFGWIPSSEVSGVGHLWKPDGFMPNGFGAVIAGMLITMFSFMGTEIVTIAAAESPNPEKGITRAVNSVIWRISSSSMAIGTEEYTCLPARRAASVSRTSIERPMAYPTTLRQSPSSGCRNPGMDFMRGQAGTTAHLANRTMPVA